MAIIKPNNNTISAITALPNGIVSASALASGVGGKVLQVVSASKNDDFSTTSTSYVDVTGLTVDITPASTSNIVLGLIKRNAFRISGVSAKVMPILLPLDNISIVFGSPRCLLKSIILKLTH